MPIYPPKKASQVWNRGICHVVLHKNVADALIFSSLSLSPSCSQK